MKVVRVNPDCTTVVVVGYCDDFEPAPRPGDYVQAIEPLPEDIAMDAPKAMDYALRVVCYPVIAVRGDLGIRYFAIEARPNGPPLEWLPGWRPATPSVTPRPATD